MKEVILAIEKKDCGVPDVESQAVAKPFVQPSLNHFAKPFATATPADVSRCITPRHEGSCCPERVAKGFVKGFVNGCTKGFS